MSETKIEIPLPPLGRRLAAAVCSGSDGGGASGATHGALVGILRQQEGGPAAAEAAPGSMRPIALILHGVLAHKDQLFHRKLAASLPMDSFRFDFRHAVEGGESREETGGPAWSMSNFADDVVDMHVVVRYLREAYNYHVEAIVSHSRGTLDSWTYYWDLEQRRRGAVSNRRDGFVLDRPPLYVAIAGRWDMARMRQRVPVYQAQFDAQGWYDWKVRVAGRPVSVRIEPAMVDEFATFPIQDMVRSFPADCDVLIIHGDKDPTVPVEDAYSFQTHLEHHQPAPCRRDARSGSTQLHIVPGADHTFKGHFDAVVDRTCAWLRERRNLVAQSSPDASPEARALAVRFQGQGQGQGQGQIALPQQRQSSSSKL